MSFDRIVFMCILVQPRSPNSVRGIVMAGL